MARPIHMIDLPPQLACFFVTHNLRHDEVLLTSYLSPPQKKRSKTQRAAGTKATAVMTWIIWIVCLIANIGQGGLSMLSLKSG